MQDIETLRRIRALVIPPGWTGAWICRRCHIHPTILDGYLDGSLHRVPAATGELETVVTAFLRGRLAVEGESEQAA